MGGAAIFVQLSVGPVSAHLNAALDAIIYFHPFHYIMDIYVDVGVSCHVHFLFVSFDINIDIGAQLHIEGPQFGGVAHVDFWFFGFDVYFGAQPSPPPPITLVEFYEVLKKAGPAEDNARPDDASSKDFEQLLKMAVEAGAFPDAPKDANVPDGDPQPPAPNAGVGSVWRVRGGEFQFRVSTVFAISEASLATTDDGDTSKDDPVLTDPTADLQAQSTITSYPMQVSAPIESPLRIKIYNKNASDDAKIPTGWRTNFVVKQVPQALWGNPTTYHPVDALLHPDPDPKKQVPATVPLNMAVSLLAPPPTLAESKIPPVNAVLLMQGHIEPDHFLQETESQTQMFPDTIANTVTANLDPDHVQNRVKQWAQFQKKWEDCNKDAAGAEDLASALVSELGWDSPPPDVLTKVGDTTPKPWDLKTGFPTRLVTGTGKKDVGDGLANTYLALPRVMAV
jgi:hypothetical protein